MIFDITIVIVLGDHELCPYDTANNKYVCSDCSTDRPFPHLSPSPRAPYFLRYNNIEIRPNNNPTVTSKCSSERKSHIFLTLNQKLEMISFSEEGMSKAKIGQKLGLLYQLAKL